MAYLIIAQQAKAVFLGFVQEKTKLENKELHSEAENIICEDEVDAKYVLVGKQLAEIGDKVNEENKEAFEVMANLLDIKSDSLVIQFMNIVDLIDCSNQGRILVLFCFAYYLLRRFTKEIFQKILLCISNFVGISLARWIYNQGGWTAIVQKSTQNLPWIIVAGVAATLIVGFFALRKS
ncbi:bcl-2 homologous antagonist/killer isoform X2 [Octopus bimaculoides]|uniref:bcl-2 homologous antagonist/killer isoform X2 n=1 Tax=Octopus bimaculoides TaxID=37653 RepID=UPI00071DCC29|nr:bcl-2 homologous antagonist/killer isoform X2 [Octopus bimaculoides]|eukprot:XP_014769559.1 PREDICTED: bcl-2 homologous antagonist/killer-like isoform X2 [Octopus bimaculoides]